MMEELFKVLMNLAIISITIERAFTVLFSIGFIKNIVASEGRILKGTDLKSGIILVVSIFIAKSLDYRILAILTENTNIVSDFMLWIDWVMTGALISGGSDMINNYIRKIVAQRKLTEELLKEKKIENENLENK